MGQQQQQVIEAWGSNPQNKLTSDGTTKYFNILATDGGGIRGIIPLQTIAYLEDGTYEYAVKQGYIQKKPDDQPQKLFMPQFFDIMAGTSIGGLISAILTVPNPDYPNDVARPLYSTDKALELMTTKGGIIFQKLNMSVFQEVIWGIVIFIVGAAFSYWAGKKCFTNKEYENQMLSVEKHINFTQKLNSDSKVDQEGKVAPQSLADQLKVALISKIRIEGDTELNAKLEDNSEIAILEARYVLHQRIKKYNKHKKCVWVVFTCGSFVSLIFAIFLPQIIYFATKTSTYGRANLDQQLYETFGDELMISESLRELTLVSYEYISQTARIYSRWSSQQDPNVYDISFYDATGATSAAPYYFDPKIRYTQDGTKEYLIDGGIIANNPSIYAEQVAEVNKNNLPVRLISLGTGAYESQPINATDFSVADWWMQAGFMTTSISQKNANVVSAIQASNYVRVQCVSDIALDASQDVDLLLKQGDDMTAANKDILDQLIVILVEENKASLIASQNQVN